VLPHLLRRLPVLLLTLLSVAALTFLLSRLLPGDTARLVLGPDASPEQVTALREKMGLDEPLVVQFMQWVGGVLTGDLGRSYITNQPVMEAILDRAPVSIQVGVMAILIALVIAVPLGMWTAYRAGGWLDKSAGVVTFGLLAVPNFIAAIALIYLFAIVFPVLPATGWVPFSTDPIGSLTTALLPALSLAIAELAVYVRLLRSDMITTLQEDFVTMARVKGVSPRRILFSHALRPSSFSLMTVVGVQLGAVIGGAVVIETLFALPGVGRLLFDAVVQRDFIIVQGVALMIAVSYVVINFIVDMLYSALDPRISHDSLRRA
jgi:peptide/nickel transport system permease protein